MLLFRRYRIAKLLKFIQLGTCSTLTCWNSLRVFFSPSFRVIGILSTVKNNNMLQASKERMPCASPAPLQCIPGAAEVPVLWEGGSFCWMTLTNTWTGLQSWIIPCAEEERERSSRFIASFIFPLLESL